MTVKIQRECNTVAANEVKRITALVTVKAPNEKTVAVAEAAFNRQFGVDLVAVLDVSGSMQGDKIMLLRHTLLAAIDLLDPSDRLSIIKFQSSATRLTPLLRMTDSGKITSREAVVRLAAGGGTDISAALRMAVAVVEGRRQRNPVATVLLLSDGQDQGAFRTYGQLVARAQAVGATVSTFGCGSCGTREGLRHS